MDGIWVAVQSVSIEALDELVAVYNLEVEDYHTYFVSKDGVLVHNTCYPQRETLMSAAAQEGSGGVTAAGRAYQKHNARGGAFAGETSGKAGQNTQRGLSYVDKILNSPDATYTYRTHNAYGEILDIRLPDGMGARWSADGLRFIGFLEPYSIR